MNIIEVVKKENVDKKYTTWHKGEERTVKVVKCHGENYDLVEIVQDDKNGYKDRNLLDIMYMSELVKLEFEEMINWNKVKTDTFILVSNDNKSWERALFAFCENGNVYAWDNGKCSFTCAGAKVLATSWKYAKLY